MKTMKNMSCMRYPTLLMAAGLIFLASCEDKLDFSGKDTASVQNEAEVDGYFEDTDDMTVMAISADNGTATGARESSGRIITKDKLDFRFACATTTLDFAVDNTQQVPHGTITIDFGAEGCTDVKGNLRKGKIIIEFKGRRFMPGSSVTATLSAYSINNIKVEGKRTVTNVSGSTEESPKFTIVLVDGKATWPDNTVATREVNRLREWVRGANPLQDEWKVTGTAAGSNRSGSVYEMSITSALVYKRECAIGSRVFMAVQGSKELTVDGKKITIDYGTGTCDKTVTITVNGQSKQVEVRGDI